jgi:hypothetical protein
VTTDSNTAVGNAAISSAFTANVLIANTVRVSNSTSNIVITVPNTVQISTGDYFLNADGNWTLVISPVEILSTNTSLTSSQIIDSYNMSEFGGVEYFVRVKNNLADGYHATKILTFHNNVNAFSTEYGVMTFNGSLGTFAVSTNTTHVILTMTPTSACTTVNIARVNF